MAGSGLLLIMSLACQGVPGADAQALVEQLGSPRYIERQAAEKALEGMGRQALTSLQLASGSQDLEVRMRATALLSRIEGTLLTQPTLVRLDFKERPIDDVARSLSERTGVNITLLPARSARWSSERISLQETDPLPFWKAIDRFCSAASVFHEPGLRGFVARQEAALFLTEQAGSRVRPVSDHGPLRIVFMGLQAQGPAAVIAAPPATREGPVAPPPPRREIPTPLPRPVVNLLSAVQLQVIAEPRLGLSQVGALQVFEARDDKGNSLVAAGAASPAMSLGQSYPGGSSSAVLNLRVFLNRPAEPGRSLRLLRGSIPLRITARQPDPLIAPLDGPMGKVLEKGDVQVVVHEVRSDPNTRQWQVELTVRSSRDSGFPSPEDALASEFGGRFNSRRRQIELVDALGQIVPWVEIHLDQETSRFTLTAAGRPSSQLKELRYYRLTETRMDAPFTFSELPMP